MLQWRGNRRDMTGREKQLKIASFLSTSTSSRSFFTKTANHTSQTGRVPTILSTNYFFFFRIFSLVVIYITSDSIVRGATTFQESPCCSLSYNNGLSNAVSNIWRICLAIELKPKRSNWNRKNWFICFFIIDQTDFSFFYWLGCLWMKQPSLKNVQLS